MPQPTSAYADFAGTYTFQSGSGNGVSDCQGVVRVEANPLENQILIFQTHPTDGGNGFLDGFFNINQGPKNDCCQPSDFTYHHDELTIGKDFFVQSTVHDYYQTLSVSEVDLFQSSLVLSGNALVLSSVMQDYQQPSRSSARTCVFVKN